MKANFKLTGLLAAMFLFAACSSKKGGDPQPDPNPEGNYKYVFVAYSVGTEGVESAPYIISSNSVTEGTLDLSKGIETDAYSFVVQNNTLFAAVYGFEGQGPITPYKLDADGNVKQIGNKINAVTAAIYNTAGTKEWVGAGWAGSATDPNATIFRVDAENLQLAGTNSIDLTPAAIGNEWPQWNGIFPVDQDKLFIPYETYPENGSTVNADKANILILNYPALTIKKVIRDTRTGVIGGWFGMHGIKQIEDGDVYTWSTGYNTPNPSAFLRVKKGTEDFDQDYFFNVEDISGGLALGRAEYLGGYKFLTSFFIDESQQGEWLGRTKLAIVDVQTKKLTWVAGIPEHAQMDYKQKIYLEPDKKTVHYVFKTDEGRFFVYNIDIATSSAKQGLEFKNVADITTISKLTY